MKKTATTAFAFFIVIFIFLVFTVSFCGAASGAGAQEQKKQKAASVTVSANAHSAAGQKAWVEEFNGVCADTTASMMLSTDQLKARMGRADALKQRLGSLGESARKVYSRRLKMCRGMYGFALAVKQKQGKK